ncbi:hypothetical protein IPP75_02600 [Candidatus Saccharibacteria bacterium]|nr:MAG: hypothetical protein IPP75_02600 [Candidatus Saccharibacteria bacterium]
MAIEKNIEDSIKVQRESLNELYNKLDSERQDKINHSISITISLSQTLISLSLTLGAAVVPLLLAVQNISKENVAFLGCGSIILIFNAIYLLIRMKSTAESNDLNAQIFGLREQKIIISYRNMLTKALLTSDIEYFTTYNKLTRKDASNVTNNYSSNQVLARTDISSDVAIALLLVGITFIARPIGNEFSINIYSMFIILIVLAMSYYIYLQKKLGIKKINHLETLQKAVLAQEKDINDFVNNLMQRKSNGNRTPKSAARKKAS